MDSSNQDAPQAQPQQQLPDGAASMMPHVDLNGMSHISAGLNNHLDPNTMAAMMSDPSLMPDATMLGLAMQDPSLMMNPMMMPNGNGILPPQPQPNGGISADEIALYDRQIRLWGMAAQAKIQSANILLITIKALANEIAKNLVLAGVGSLTIIDDAIVTEADLGAQFFLSEEDNVIGKNRAQAASAAMQKLNPRVQVHVDAEGIKTKGPSYFAGFDVVIATDLDPDSFNLINTATRLHGKAFYAAGSHGFYGFIFSDLIEHDYVIQRDMGNVPTQPKQETRTRSIVNVTTKKDGPKTIESVTKRELYSTWFLASDVANLPDDYKRPLKRKSVTPALSCLRALWEFMQLQNGRTPSTHDDLKMFTQIATQKHKALNLPSETLKPEFLRSFLQNLDSEIAPVTAMLGGQLAQDVINVLGQTQQPIQNMVVLDGTTMEARMYPLHPEGTLGANLLTLTDSMVPNGGGMMMPSMGGITGIPMDAGTMGVLPHHNNMTMPIPQDLGNMAFQDRSANVPQPQDPPQVTAHPVAEGQENPERETTA
ncbi:Fc.00g077610.m01.CDS01 [Cosmosporella sp. VM-42]